MKIHDSFPQGSPEWFQIRCRKATASEFSSVLAKGEGKMRAKVLRRIVAECLTGKPTESYSNSHMERGQDQEPLAGMAYELATDNIIRRVGFIDHDNLRAGCSPDGLIHGVRKGVEFKCVIPTVQVETALRGTYPPEHKAQIQGSMWITGYEEWDFCSYSPDMPEHLRTYVFTVKRDEAYIKELEREVTRLLAEVDQTLSRLRPGGEDLEGLLRQSLKEAA